MALTTDRFIGKQIVPTVNGVKTDWDEFDINEEYSEEDCSAADTDEDEVVQIKRKLSGKISGFQGSANNAGTLPKIGDSITDLAAKIGTDSVIPSLVGYTGIKVTKTNYNFKQGPAKFSFEFRSGVRN